MHMNMQNADENLLKITLMLKLNEDTSILDNASLPTNRQWN